MLENDYEPSVTLKKIKNRLPEDIISSRFFYSRWTVKYSKRTNIDYKNSHYILGVRECEFLIKQMGV
jgi:hypothetical protein